MKFHQKKKQNVINKLSLTLNNLNINNINDYSKERNSSIISKKIKNNLEYVPKEVKITKKDKDLSLALNIDSEKFIKEDKSDKIDSNKISDKDYDIIEKYKTIINDYKTIELNMDIYNEILKNN